MLPCQTGCPDYCAGCHKSCSHWTALQDEQRDQRQAKKQYLRFYGAQCAQMIHQFESMQVRYPSR